MKTPSKIFTWSFHLKSTFSDFCSKKWFFWKLIDPDLENETKNQKSVNFPPLEIMWSLSQWNTGFRNFGQIGDQFDHFFFWHIIFWLSPTPSHHLADAVRHPQNPGFSGFATVFEWGFLQGYWTDFQNFKSFRKFTARSFTMCARFSCRFPVAFPKNCKQ